MMRRDVNAIEALGAALIGTGKPLVATSGTLVMPIGNDASETDDPDPDGLAPFRIAGERACLAFADHGVRAVVMRLAPTVHGPPARMTTGSCRCSSPITTAKQTGFSAYVGVGSNRWPAVHRADAAVLYRLALETAAAGSAVHRVAESVSFLDIARTVGDTLGIPTRSISPEDAAKHFINPFMGLIYGADVPASSDLTRERLGWVPTQPGLLHDLAHGDYVSQAAS